MPYAHGMYQQRTDRIAGLLHSMGLDGLLVTHPTNYLYLAGFRGSAGCLLIRPKQHYILTDFRYHERVRREVDPGYELVDTSGLSLADDVLPRLLTEPAPFRLGVEAEYITYETFAGLAAIPGVELQPVSGVVDGLRAIKDTGEIEAIRSSQLLTERIYSEILRLVGPDITEADLAAEVEYRARKHGASATSFPPIIAGGERAAQPHAGVSPEKIAPGVPLIIDMGVVLNDYCSDMTRTVFLRDCPQKWERVYNLVREAKDLAFGAIRPGVPAADVDKVARDHITAAGYGEMFRHGLGHGVGLPFKGAPVLHWASTDVLAPGHVASNEPGIYLPGEGGVRIEDLLYVTQTGAEYFNQLGTELTVLG